MSLDRGRFPSSPRMEQADRDLENALKFSETRTIGSDFDADRPKLQIDFWPAGKIGDDDERG
jgi:hypothetical protein